MSVSPSQQEMKRIFEKSIRLLDSSQNQLKEARSALRKSVRSLACLNTGKVIRVNEIMARVTESVAEEIDLHTLESTLDDLTEVLRESGYDAISSGEALRTNIEKSLNDDGFLDDSASLKQRLGELIESCASEDELAGSVVQLFSELAQSANHHELLSNQQMAAVDMFIQNICDASGLEPQGDLEGCDEILSHLYNDLKPLVEQGRLSDAKVSADDAEEVNINHLLIEFVNNLSLHESVSVARKSFNAKLNYPVKTADDWRDVISTLDDIVNDSISALESEKKLLQEYVARIIKQLANVESYIQTNRDESSTAMDETSRLNQLVNSDIENMSELLDSAEDLETLQRDVQSYLEHIRQTVDDNLRSAEEREIRSVEGFSAIMTELVDAQRESESLKEQLNDSHRRLLRDELTGLPNRMAFNERISAEYNRWLRDKPALTLAIWDIDHFKNINDTYGHDIGDRVLKIVAKLVHSRVRKTDMFARYGGEEFVLLMPDTPIEPALDINNKLREKLAETGFHYDGEKCLITSSVGIASFHEGDTIEDVMKRADIALYRSKDEGRNLCHISTPE